ncbi:MAG: phosphoribosylaminoimidazolesuccinocarboxamide synthase [Candidatus Eisenbacteria bacterium]
MNSLTEISLGQLKPDRRGKVRDVYDTGDGRLVILATDRISAYDAVLPTGIPDKGKVLTALSAFWFEKVGRIVETHYITSDPEEFPAEFVPHASVLAGRAMLVRKAARVDFECVVRGYLAGSAWQEYRDSGTVACEPAEPGLKESVRFRRPVFSPATKSESGHDENISFARLEKDLGPELARELRAVSIELYEFGAAHCEECGLILADTKFEFGLYDGRLLLIDELISPDSSRFWPHDSYEPGRPQESFDKQFVRDYLNSIGWDRRPPPPPLPPEVVTRTRDRYFEALARICGRVDP